MKKKIFAGFILRRYKLKQTLCFESADHVHLTDGLANGAAAAPSAREKCDSVGQDL